MARIIDSGGAARSGLNPWARPVISVPFLLSVIIFAERILATNPALYDAIRTFIVFGTYPQHLKDLVYRALGTAPGYAVIPVLGYLIGFVVTSARISLLQFSRIVDRFRQALFEGVLEYRANAIRLLRYLEYDGILFNDTANDTANSPRNVLLNNTTLQRILGALKDQSDDALAETGLQCGSGFGNVLLGLQGVDRSDLVSLLSLWFKYDSNAGFGRFDMDSGAIESRKLRIVLHYNFLTAGGYYREPDRSLCAFMRGYITGVLLSLPPEALQSIDLDKDGLRVIHDPYSINCICTSHNDDRGCIFDVVG